MEKPGCLSNFRQPVVSELPARVLFRDHFSKTFTSRFCSITPPGPVCFTTYRAGITTPCPICIRRGFKVGLAANNDSNFTL